MSRRFVSCKNGGFPFAAVLSYLPEMNFIGESLCAQYLFYPLKYFDDIRHTYISGQDDMSRASLLLL